MMDAWPTLAFSRVGRFQEIGFDGFDDVREGDAAWQTGEGVAARFPSLARHEVGTLEFIENLH